MGQESKEQQQRTVFTRFVNSALVKGGYEPINDIVDDIPNGIYLSHFLMALKTNTEKVKKKAQGGTIDLLLREPKPKNRFADLSNLNGALKFIELDGVKLVNIGSEDLHEKNEKLVLGLIFTLTLFYLSSGNDSNVVKDLLNFVNEILNQHKDEFGVDPIKNLEQDPHIIDGRVFKVLNNHFTPDENKANLSEFEREPKDKAAHFNQAMDDGKNHLNIPALLDAKDMENPDEKAVIMQLIQYKQLSNKQNQSDYLKSQLNKKLHKAVEAKEKAKKIDMEIDDLLKWVNDRIKTMDDQPEDLHPDKIPVEEDFLDKHFKESKDKRKEYEKVVADLAQLKNDCTANKIATPRTKIASLNNAFQKLPVSERGKIDYIQKMKDVYAKLRVLLKRFQRLLASCTANAKNVSNDSEDISQKSKDATIATIDDIGIKTDLVDTHFDNSKGEQEHFDNFVENKIKTSCPNKQYFEDNFGNKLQDCKKALDDAGDKLKQSHSDYENAKDRLDKIKDNLKENAKTLVAARKKIDEGKVIVQEDPNFGYLENLEDYLDELEGINLNGIKNNLDNCKKLDDEIEKLAGRKVDNPYTAESTDPLLEELKNLSDDTSAKINDLDGEKKRLTDLSAKYKEFNERKENINQHLDEVNKKIDSINDSNEPNDKIKEHLSGLSVEVEAVYPSVENLQNTVGEVPDLVNQCRLVTTRCDEIISNIKHQIDILDSKPESNDEEIVLTEQEVSKITTNFRKVDVENQKEITYPKFCEIAMNVTPLGINNITEQSHELKEFFLHYSTDKSTIVLEKLLEGYLDYKIKFTNQNKDAVMKLLTDKADAENYITESDLKATVSSEVFQEITALIQPVERNGKNCFPLNELVL